MVCCSLTQPHPPINGDRPIRYRVTLALVLCSQAQMAVKPSEAIFLLMRLQPEYSSAKGAVRSALLRSRILQVRSLGHRSPPIGSSDCYFLLISKTSRLRWTRGNIHYHQWGYQWSRESLSECISHQSFTSESCGRISHYGILYVTSVAASEFSKRIKHLLLLLQSKVSVTSRETHHQTSVLRNSFI